jgi:hypothetical protein
MIFLNILPKKWRKYWRFLPNYCYFLKKIDHNIGFGEKRQLLRTKLAKIAENRDHIIDPRKSRLEISAKCKTT